MPPSTTNDSRWRCCPLSAANSWGVSMVGSGFFPQLLFLRYASKCRWCLDHYVCLLHDLSWCATLRVFFQVPWADLRYLFGEIMYGGHIVNDFDR